MPLGVDHHELTRRHSCRLGTSCEGVDIVDDLQDEASKRNLQEKIDGAVSAALDSQRKQASSSEVCIATALPERV
jgi:phage gp29-like protein